LFSVVVSFMIEFIKSKQDETITKELIKTRELDQSMLRLTRIFEEKSNFQRDESSVAYSCVMTESKRCHCFTEQDY
jgi:hypothetical protein